MATGQDIPLPAADAVAAIAVGIEAIGCPSTPLRRDGKLWVQEYERDGIANGAIVIPATVETSAALYLNRSAWAGYGQIGSSDGRLAQKTAGVPTAIIQDGSVVQIELSEGYLLVAEHYDAPYFWMPPPVVEYWQDHGTATGTLGLPTSNPLPDLHQDFTHGTLRFAEGKLTFEPPNSDSIPTNQEALEGRIVRQEDRTAWFVEDYERLWIPDGGTYLCLGGDEAAYTLQAPGWYLSQLPFGGIATCAN